MVKLVDAEDSKSSGPCALASSILASGTNKANEGADLHPLFFAENDVINGRYMIGVSAVTAIALFYHGIGK